VIRGKKVLVNKPRWSEKRELPGGAVELGKKLMQPWSANAMKKQDIQ